MTVKTKVEEQVDAILAADEVATVEIPDAPPAEVPARELETSKPLKLSEAMRIGSITTTQVFGKLGNVAAGEGAACGIGAVLAGLGYGFGDSVSWHTMVSKNPELKALMVPINAAAVTNCGCHHAGSTVVDGIIHLNDYHRMPRKDIADRLEKAGL